MCKKKEKTNAELFEILVSSNTYLSMPFANNKENSYISLIKDYFDKYKKFLLQVVGKMDIFNDTNLVETVDDICEILISIVQKHLDGNSYENYRDLENIVINYFNLEINDLTFGLKPDCYLYRARLCPDVLYDRSDMFHIPFNKRNLVQKYRFSIAGYPCLYLASSPYTCWLELNRPNISNIWLSVFRSTKVIEVLDLAYDLNILSQNYSNGKISDSELIKKLKLYPVVISSCIRTRYPNSSFHEEYIISELLLGLSKNWSSLGWNWKGIRYISTKLECVRPEYLDKSCSYIFPPKSYEEGVDFDSYLKNTFVLSKPQHWTALTSLGSAGDVVAYSTVSGENIDEMIFKSYGCTDFYSAGEHLCNLTMDKI